MMNLSCPQNYNSSLMMILSKQVVWYVNKMIIICCLIHHGKNHGPLFNFKCGLSDYRPHNLSPQLPERRPPTPSSSSHLLVLFCGQPHYVFHVQEIDLFLLVKELMFWEFDHDNLFLMKSYSLWGVVSCACCCYIRWVSTAHSGLKMEKLCNKKM